MWSPQVCTVRDPRVDLEADGSAFLEQREVKPRAVAVGEKTERVLWRDWWVGGEKDRGRHQDTEKREERPKTAKSQKRPRPNKGTHKVQQSSAGQLFLNNIQQQQLHKIYIGSGTTARQLASSQALRYMRARTTRINVPEIYEVPNWHPAE